LVYAQLVSGKAPEAMLFDARAYFAVDDGEWEALDPHSPYLPDPRAGHLPASTWAKISDDVSNALHQLHGDRERIEMAIQKASTRWRLDRMPMVDRALLMVGCFELVSRGARPAKRVINRTVELAKQYGEADSRRFINGILDQIRKDWGIEAG
jgi:transcription antitermination factor NusB